MTLYTTADGLPGIGISEWRADERLPGVRMAARDLRLAEQLRGRPQDSRLDVRPAEDGITIDSTGAVGLVRFTTFEVRVDPKLPGDHLQLFRMVEFAQGLDGLAQLAGTPRLKDADPNLLDLVVELLATATDRILTGGLRADYVEREDDLPALRGRLLLERQYIDRFGLFDRLACRYDEHEHDIPDNQLLALALREGSRLATLPRVRRRARGLALALEEVCNPDALDLDAGPAAFSYSRHNEHYRIAHELAWMVVGQRGLDESLRTGAARVRSFLIDMNTLFERFLEKLLKVLLEPSGIAVRAQRADSIFWRPETGTRYARVRPDLLLERNERRAARLPIDAKYKRYDGKKVDVDDLTQVFLYGYAYRDPEAVTPPAAILIHPSETPGSPQPLQLQVRSVEERGVDAKLTIVGVHIPSMLDEVDARSGPGVQALHDLLQARVPPVALPLLIAAANADG